MPQIVRLYTAAFLVGMSFAGQAGAADSDSVEIRISGEAKPVCALPAQPDSATVNAQFSNNVLTIDKLLDDNTAIVKASSANLTFRQVMCNYGATITLATQKGGMTSDGVTTDLTGGSFLKRVDYKVRGSWGNLQLTELDTAGASPGAQVTTQAGGANNGDLTLTILTEDGNTPVVEGVFDDLLVLKIGAAY
jgi:hypothetical protein